MPTPSYGLWCVSDRRHTENRSVAWHARCGVIAGSMWKAGDRRLGGYFSRQCRRHLMVFGVSQIGDTPKTEVWRGMQGAASLQAQCGKLVIAVSEDISPDNADAILWSLVCLRSETHRKPKCGVACKVRRHCRLNVESW